MPIQEQTAVVSLWKNNWQSTDYRRKLISGLIIISLILITLPFFYQAIEQRNGIKFNDYLLQWLPAYDLSLFIFVTIWSMALLTFHRFKQDPQIFLTFLWGFILINLSRFVSIGLVPLNAPDSLVAIHDPISNYFYGPKFITKDLFFSGHTAAMFLMFLCLKKRSDKILTFIATIVIGIAVLIQHVHYTMDVFMAPIITYFLWVAAKKIVEA
ncbi:phosphatase PAP2-related protein [Daejeonella lutea]|uniref:PAP2 superfamily C-terminal n=1 Tax=Daejeonella lutea TaxID=572036 RepID=A0A1T5B5W8_9SPHI|nr:phosphatase PAP2-related protein [Daejeonella lutea]SKB42616.1 PAP2 superfamily C-terminal [Daejeonella lutea]